MMRSGRPRIPSITFWVYDFIYLYFGGGIVIHTPFIASGVTLTNGDYRLSFGQT